MNKEVITKSIEETQKFAQEFAGKLKSGNIIALYGELGAGKTIFVQGLAKGLGFRGKVFSPTFIFMRPYKLEGKIKTLYHIDLYRLEGIMDLLAASGIVRSRALGNLRSCGTLEDNPYGSSLIRTQPVLKYRFRMSGDRR